MAVANGTPYNTRTLIDANFIANVALPNAANTVNTAGLNLVQAVPYPVTERVIVNVATTVGTAANSKNINVVLQHSADDNTSNYVNIPELAVFVTTGNATNHIANNRSVLLPPSVKQYIRAQATGEANGGDSSDGTLSLKLLF